MKKLIEELKEDMRESGGLILGMTLLVGIVVGLVALAWMFMFWGFR